VPLAAEAVNFLFEITSRSFWSPPVQFVPGVLSPKAVVPKVCSADPKGSASSSQGIRGYVSVMVALKVTYSLIKGIMFC
jgi:hypothetical protein